MLSNAQVLQWATQKAGFRMKASFGIDADDRDMLSRKCRNGTLSKTVRMVQNNCHRISNKFNSKFACVHSPYCHGETLPEGKFCRFGGEMDSDRWYHTPCGNVHRARALLTITNKILRLNPDATSSNMLRVFVTV